MSKNIKLRLNAQKGAINLQCSEDFYESAMEQCLQIISAYHQVVPKIKNASTKKDDVILVESSKSESSKSDVNVGKPKRQRSTSGKPANYNQIDLGLTDDQSRGLRAFYTEKAPKNQNDTVCVIAFKLKEFLNQELYLKILAHKGMESMAIQNLL